MPNSNNKPAARKTSVLTSLGMPARRFTSEFIRPAQEIRQSDAFIYGAGHTTVASLLGTGRKAARDRQTVYRKWEMMSGDAVVSAAIKLLVTSALGGHETSGDLVFIEKKPDTEKDKRLAKIVDEITSDLQHLFNKIAYQTAYTGGIFGDSYARIYANARGVIDLYIDELVRPQLVQPFEQGNRTIGYAVYTGERSFERLDISQMARLKMPRIQWVPQHGVIEKSLRIAITEDDPTNLPLMPSMTGGSLLYDAEEAYDNFYASMLGLVGQRWIDSIDEQMLAVNLESMTVEQQKRFVESIKTMLTTSKTRAEDAVKNGRPVFERIRHIMPVFGEKQLTTVGPANGGQLGRSSSISIDDIIFHARLLSGAVGVDLSMLGFADQLQGGLGEGGFFRVSAQVAERARIIRVALTDFFNQIIDIHTLRRYGIVFQQSERPWIINFYGSISALEAEKQRTRADSMNAGMLMVQAMQTFKDMGASEDQMVDFLVHDMMLDEDRAKLLAKIVNVKNEGDGGGFGQDGGGGFGHSSENNFTQPDEEEKDDGQSMDSATHDHSTLDGIGELSVIPIPRKTVKWMGFEANLSLRADLQALADRHKEYYSGDPDSVLSDIRFVLNKPDDWFIHHDNRVAIFRERIGKGAIPLVRVEFDIVGKSLIARSVYVSSKRQISKKMQEKKRELTSLGLGGNRPRALSVAEYLAVSSNRS